MGYYFWLLLSFFYIVIFFYAGITDFGAYGLFGAYLGAYGLLVFKIFYLCEVYLGAMFIDAFLDYYPIFLFNAGYLPPTFNWIFFS